MALYYWAKVTTDPSTVSVSSSHSALTMQGHLKNRSKAVHTRASPKKKTGHLTCSLKTLVDGTWQVFFLCTHVTHTHWWTKSVQMGENCLISVMNNKGIQKSIDLLRVWWLLFPLVGWSVQAVMINGTETLLWEEGNMSYYLRELLQNSMSS